MSESLEINDLMRNLTDVSSFIQAIHDIESRKTYDQILFSMASSNDI